jgi:N6-L-threonylcarbamoyladenine synthase
MAEFLTLGIESSCDETAVAVIADGVNIKSNIILSQLDLHARFGGVVPELAARSHLEVIVPIYRVAMEKAGVDLADISLIAATYGPGLVGSLLVGLTFAKGLALAGNIPFIAVNHIEGHIYANVLERPPIQTPLLCLTVSGGHTDLLYVEKWGVYKILGRTRDDAAGEAFDKVARVLGLGYPGGPAIDDLARGVPGEPEFTRLSSARVLPDSYDFSFSGLKTAVINYLHRLKQTGRDIEISQVAAGFQKIAVEQLLDKLFKAVNDYKVPSVLLSGGVAANSYLRLQCRMEAERRGLQVYYPDPQLCTDNAAMIAAAGYFRYQAGESAGLEITAQPDLKL